MWHQEKRRKNWTVFVYVLLGCLILLTACGGAEEPAPAAEGETSAEEAAPEAEEVVEEVEVEVTRVVEAEIVEEIVIEGEEPEAEEEEMAEEAPSEPEAIGSEDDDGSPFEPEGGPKVSATREAGNGWVDESLDTAVTDDNSDETAVAQIASSPTPTITPATPIEPEDEAAETVRAGEEPPVELATASQLTAGEVDDNASWPAYLDYLSGYQSNNVIPIPVNRSQVIQVTDFEGRPILGATVIIKPVGEVIPPVTLQTKSDGQVLFFPDAYPQTAGATEFSIAIQHMDISVEQEFDIEENTVLEIVWPSTVSVENPTAVDILFLIDTTGSMGDELQQLKDNILFIAQVIEGLPRQPDVRFGMTVYRDRGEAFISRTFDFTTDVVYFAEELATIEAQGGGDYPEDLNEGLFKALTVPAWRTDETIKLIFLVADAPPHIDYDDAGSYPEQMLTAAAQGIKIYPIGSSGLDRDGEYVFRQLAQFSGGKFLFLTYGAAGAGSVGEETDLAVSESGINYDVTSLDGLVIKIVEEELAHRPIE